MRPMDYLRSKEAVTRLGPMKRVSDTSIPS